MMDAGLVSEGFVQTSRRRIYSPKHGRDRIKEKPPNPLSVFLDAVSLSYAEPPNLCLTKI
jgi:hypothetical protein